LKLPDRRRWDELRHRLVLTSEEKRVIAFVVAAFLLGVGTKCYRDSHPKTPAAVEKKHSRAGKIQR